jgi:putrescine importer
MAAIPTTESSVAQSAEQGLRRNALGLFGAMIFGVVIMAPSLAIFTNWGFMVPHVGRATGIVFLIGLVMSLPTAYSYAVLSGRMPSSGSAYKWTAHLINPRLGIFIGLCASLYYAVVIPYTLPALGLLGTDLTRSSSRLLFGIILFGSLLLAIPIIYRGIAVSVETSYLLVGLEVAILAVIAVVAWISSGHHASLAPIDPGGIPSTSALVPALVLGVLSFTGYDAISTVAEETRTPRKLIPRATILAVVLVAVFWALMSLLLSNTLSPAEYNKVADGGGFPLAAAAEEAFGSAGRTIIDIMGLEASFALLVAATVGSTRVLFAMGRDGVLDRRLGRTHPRYRVPWTAITVVVVFAVLTDTLVSMYQGLNYGSALWLSNLIVFFALITYVAINICNPVYFLKHARDEFSWFKNAVVPVCGIGVTLYFLYKGFFQVLWNADFKTGRSVVLTAVVLTALAAVAAFAIARRRGVSEAAAAYTEERDDPAAPAVEGRAVEGVVG